MQCYNNSVGTSQPQQKADASTMTEQGSQTDSGIRGHLPNQQLCYKYMPSNFSDLSRVSSQTLAGQPSFPGHDYRPQLPVSTLPISFQHFLKFSGITDNNLANIKREDGQLKRGRKKKYEKEPQKKTAAARAEEMQVANALDDLAYYYCQECYMAYPDEDMLEQHLIIHKLERKYVCDICGAGLKRKEHLDRHKQGHNPDRPYVCTVCLKTFKRNEHLSRHMIIHSGDKGEVCSECGKAFYRKDHLRKHTQSHITKRLQAELLGRNEANLMGHSSVSSLVSLAPTIPVPSS